MIIECACKKYKFAVKAEEIGINGRVVQCGVCDEKWFQEPASSEEFKVLKDNHIKEEEKKKEEAKNQNVLCATPRIGELFTLQNTPIEQWWEEYD